MAKRIADYELCDLGIEHPDYFQGFGCSFTAYDNAACGIGVDPREALGDALDQVAQCGFDADSLALRIAADEGWSLDERGEVLAPTKPRAKGESYYHVGIRWTAAPDAQADPPPCPPPPPACDCRNLPDGGFYCCPCCCDILDLDLTLPEPEEYTCPTCQRIYDSHGDCACDAIELPPAFDLALAPPCPPPPPSDALPVWRELERDPFASAYVECALWSSTDNSNDQGGAPLDDNYGIEDLSDECAAEMLADCEDFQSAQREPLEASGLSIAQQAHDFWLTRNGHGAGFWDKGLGKVGQRLSEAARVYGSCDLYVGNDGKLYC